MKILLLVFLVILPLCFVHAQNNQEAISPDNCEGNSYRLDRLRNQWIDSQLLNEKGVVIIVARLGKGEYNNQLNQRRLYTVSEYLNLPAKNVIKAQGERIGELGVIEVYINGVLADTLAAKGCQDLPVGSCDNDLLDNKNYQLPKPKRKIKCGR